MKPLTAKRSFDFTCAAIGLVAISPLLVVISLAVALSDRGPVFFKQERIGRNGKTFMMWKFRTMVPNADKLGLKITVKGDSRITTIGKVLRALKLDELPQLFNVIKGEMSLVGPRPEVRMYVDMYSQEQRRVLELLPGITDPASLAYFEEEKVLASQQDPQDFYIQTVMPEKIRLNLEYAKRATFLSDLSVILSTLLRIFNRN